MAELPLASQNVCYMNHYYMPDSTQGSGLQPLHELKPNPIGVKQQYSITKNVRVLGSDGRTFSGWLLKEPFCTLKEKKLFKLMGSLSV